ncbi:MAG: T9SS type A sorting domain-containing protein [Bacteroidales bacterium]|nr:T9SS type A sorting domain-containing protein [Bacteroidales bacterium]
MKKTLYILFFIVIVETLFGQCPDTIGGASNINEQKHQVLPEQLWTDIVTEQPEGYVVDANGDVHIYSAEAMAWVSVLSNGLHGQEIDNFGGKTVYLEEDIDLAGYAWTTIATFFEEGHDIHYFEGVFEGGNHKINNLVLCDGFKIAHSGLFGNLLHGEIRNFSIENCIVDHLPCALAYDLGENSLARNVTVHCASLRSNEGTMFNTIRTNSVVENCFVHYDYMESLFFSTGYCHYNYGRILNSASIIDTLVWSYSGCSGLVYENWGEIKNCYSYWGELEGVPFYGGLVPRRGIAFANFGIIENCYYNKMPDGFGFDDGPGDGQYGDVSSFFRYDLYYNWILANPIHVCDPNLTWQFDLVDALNYWIECQDDSGDFRRWYVDPSGSNNKLPLFMRELPDPYWTDIVTEQPEGYAIEANGDVHIYSAEGLAWLCSVTNGLNGQEADDFEGKVIILETNVDMSQAIWTSICCGSTAFKGTFNGKEHVIDGLRLTKVDESRTGFFGNLLEANIFDVVIRDGFFKGSGSNIGFLASQATKSHIDHCFVECVMHGGECAPFVYSNYGSTITNSMVYSPFLRNYEDYSFWGGAFVAENRCCDEDLTLPQIINCAAIIKYMDCGLDIGFSGQNNQGLIENCYVQINEIMHCAGSAPGTPPRNGITKNNQGELVNSYYNSPLRVMSLDGLTEIPLEDISCQYNTGLVRDVVSFDSDSYGGWKLSEPITIALENGLVTTDDLLEALNFKLELMNDETLLSWCDTGMVFNNERLPVFCDFDITEIEESTASDEFVLVYPNPAHDIVVIQGVEIDELQVYNSLGQMVNTYRKGNIVTVSDLPKGLYLFRIINGKSSIITNHIIIK